MNRLSTFAALAILLTCAAGGGAYGQTYRNIVNSRFRTVANGPMQAMVVDVSRAADTAGAWRSIARRVAQVRQARAGALQRQMDALRRLYPHRRLTLAIPDIVVLRRDGQLVRAPATRAARASNDITFDFPTSGDGSWTAAQVADLSGIAKIVYPILKTVYGDPQWSGHVTVIDGDNTSPIIGDPDALSGGVYNVSTRQIIFAQFNSPQTRVLALTQMMALAFHGDASISFDAWERGMARAATLVAVTTALPQLEPVYGTGSIDVSDPLWSALDRYDLLNQPPLGNDRFYPVAAVNGIANTVTFPNMLIPRLMMAGTAWLKALTADPSLLKTFNAAYYAAFSGNPDLANSVPDLRNLMAQALTTDGVPTIEGLPFQTWYEQQYALDTSVTQGEKLYALVSAIRPDPSDSSGGDDFALGIVAYYYRTGFDATANSTETNLNGTIYPIYWDYTYTNRLFLAAQYERIDITAGLGTVAPTFFDVLGGDPTLHSRMRITIELPINGQVVRLQTAPRSMGALVGSENNFWGTVVGADTGTINIVTETGVNATLNVAQGAFGGQINSLAFARPGRSTITFTPAGGGAAVTRQVVTGPGEYVCVLYAASTLTSISQTLPQGLFMASFPIRPARSKAADALLDPKTGEPIFTDDTLLMAHWLQTSAGANKYELYPAMEPLQPGIGYWLNLPADTPMQIQGNVLSQDTFYSVGLTYGWNQIGDPFLSPIDISNLQFQYLADNVSVPLSTAIANGWVDATSTTSATSTGVWQYDSTLGYQPASQLQPWYGYWIRVLVSEGVTITYPNPNAPAPSAVAARRPTSSRAPATVQTKAPAKSTAWLMALQMRGPGGTGASAVLGEAAGASAGFDRSYDALLPPAPARAAPSLAFAHTDWGDNSGDYYSDMHPTGATDSWTVTAGTPAPNGTYTLTWNALQPLPRSVRLILTDLATNRRLYLQTSSGYTFTQSGAGTRSFRIDVENRSRSALRITDLNARVSRAPGAGSVDIGFQLTAGATVDTRIRSATGRVIRTLAMGRALTSGQNTVMWDMRDNRGISVPTGVYLVEVSARTPDGDAARVVLPVTVVR